MKFDYLGEQGHYYWREIETNRIVVSDKSADTQTVGDPRNTDDGVLYVDLGSLHDLRLNVDFKGLLPMHGYSIPVIDPSGEESLIIATYKEFMYVLGLAKDDAEKTSLYVVTVDTMFCYSVDTDGVTSVEEAREKAKADLKFRLEHNRLDWQVEEE
jgi:hypothetical protein